MSKIRHTNTTRPRRFGPFGYPFGGAGRERPLVACWVLGMLAALLPDAGVVTLVPVVGYLVRVLDASAVGDEAPEMGADVAKLLRQGVGGVAVAVGYLTVPGVALLVTVYGATTTSAGAGIGAGQGVALYAGSTVVLSLFLLAAYLVPAGIAVYAKQESLRAAFSIASVTPLAGHAAYFSRWMAGAVALSMASAVASVSLQVHRAGPVIASLLAVYGAVLACHVWGRGVALARER